MATTKKRKPRKRNNPAYSRAALKLRKAAARLMGVKFSPGVQGKSAIDWKREAHYAGSTQRRKAKRNPRPKAKKSVLLRGFTGRVTHNKNGTVSIQGVNHAPASMRRPAAKRKTVRRRRAR